MAETGPDMLVKACRLTTHCKANECHFGHVADVVADSTGQKDNIYNCGQTVDKTDFKQKLKELILFLFTS